MLSQKVRPIFSFLPFFLIMQNRVCVHWTSSFYAYTIKVINESGKYFEWIITADIFSYTFFVHIGLHAYYTQMILFSTKEDAKMVK